MIPALIRRFHEAKVNGAPTVSIWGTGAPRREFLYVDDLASASVHVLNLPKMLYDQHTKQMLTHLNVGCGHDIAIRELAELIGEVVNYEGEIKFDAGKPDGTARKLMDSSRINALGWRPTMTLENGLRLVYENFKKIIFNS